MLALVKCIHLPCPVVLGQHFQHAHIEAVIYASPKSTET